MTRQSEGLKPDLFNLAWAPVNDFRSLEMLDQFNGVPTLAVISTASEGDHLVWQSLGIGEVSLWLYVPLTARLRRLVERKTTLEGVIFNLNGSRYGTVGVAINNRIFFEREYHLQPGQDAEQTFSAVADFVRQALNMALKLDLPGSRKDLIRQAKRELQTVT